MFSLRITDALGGERIARFKPFKNHVFLGMMAAIWIILKIINNGSNYFIIRALTAIEDLKFVFENFEQLFDVAVFVAEQLDHSGHRHSCRFLPASAVVSRRTNAAAASR